MPSHVLSVRKFCCFSFLSVIVTQEEFDFNATGFGLGHWQCTECLKVYDVCLFLSGWFSECHAFLLSQHGMFSSDLEMDWMSGISGIHMPNDSAEWKLIYSLVDVKSDCCYMIVTMTTEADLIYHKLPL